MKKYVCLICGFVYDEARGMPEAGIAPLTTWEQLPDDWVCPICGAGKSQFQEQGVSETPAEKPAETPAPVRERPSDLRALSALEISAVCSNLARGCEKQYKAEEAAAYRELADFFKASAAPAPKPEIDELLSLVNRDLNAGFASANAAAAEEGDRGAKRALVWSEKVTRILHALLERYAKEGDAMLENTGVYVCSICGFVYVGQTPPALCPVCKVPGWKFEKVEGR